MLLLWLCREPGLEEFQDRQASFTVCFYSVSEYAVAMGINAPVTVAVGLDPAECVHISIIYVPGSSDVPGVTRTGGGMRYKIPRFLQGDPPA